MIRLAVLKFLCLIAFLPVLAQNEPSVQAEPLIEDSSNFIRAYLMVAEPYYRYPQSSFGHGFLRMQSVPNNLDYCFSLESGNYEGLFDICLGNYPNRLVPVPTEEYIQTFTREGRIVTGYPLNIRLEEGQRLWKLLDETATAGESPYHDYFHHGCSLEVIRMLERSLDGRIVFGDSAKQFDGTFFTLGNRLLPPNSWMHIPPSMLSTTEGTDRQLPDIEKATYPIAIPTLFADATIEAPDGTHRPFFKPGVKPEEFRPQRRYVNTDAPIIVWFSLLFAVTAVFCALGLLVKQRWAQCLAWGWAAVLFVFYCLLAMVMTCICLLSSLPTIHGWNWNLLVYNLIPLGVWIFSLFRPFSESLWRRIHLGYALWLCAFMVVMLAWGGHQIMEQYLLVGTFAVYCFYRWMKPSQVLSTQPVG